MKIGFDLDGVCIDLYAPLNAFINERFPEIPRRRFGRPLLVSDMTQYDYDLVLGIPVNTMDEILKEFYASKAFEEDVHVYPGTKEVLDRICARGYLPVAVTARQSDLADITHHVLRRELGAVFGENVHFTRHDGTTIPKSTVCIREGIRVLVEDSPTNIVDCSSKSVTVYVRKHPWNLEQQDLPGVIPVDDLPDFERKHFESEE